MFRKFLIFILLGFPVAVFSQTVLEADGPGNTYELINSVLAPGYDVVESPECIHPEFGRHIAEVWDDELKKYVFEFYIHVTPDNDRCLNFDRQRVEIKTYDKSPANLIGVSGETVVYKWKFRIPSGFQPSTSFTHIHQIKAVGGDDDMPLFTLTVRKASPNRIELIHNNVTRCVTASLSLFEGTWVEATERVKVDSVHGSYSISIRKVSDGTTLLSYTNNDLMTIRYNNDLIRPKWGIYRSLNSPESLRDEALRFSGFSIAEETPSAVIPNLKQDKRAFSVSQSSSDHLIHVQYALNQDSDVRLDIIGMNGVTERTLINQKRKMMGHYSNTFDVSDLSGGFHLLRFHSGEQSLSEKMVLVR